MFISVLKGMVAMGLVARAVVEPSRDIESLRGRMGESTRQGEGLVESLLSERFRN